MSNLYQKISKPVSSAEKSDDSVYSSSTEQNFSTSTIDEKLKQCKTITHICDSCEELSYIQEDKWSSATSVFCIP